MKNALSIVSKKIRDFRCFSRMTTKELSVLIGVSQQQMSRYKRGVNNISAYIIYRLSIVFKCSINEFSSDENESEAACLTNRYNLESSAIIDYLH